jgi:FkbM family methyltransferase
MSFAENNLEPPKNISDMITTHLGENGFVIFGPYTEYAPGTYYVVFTVLLADRFDVEADDLVAVVDVAANEGRTILATSNVFRKRLAENESEIILPFQLSEPANLEFRVQSTGRAKLLVDRNRRVESDPGNVSQYCPVMALGRTPESTFIKQFYPHIRYIYEKGISWSIKDDGIVAIIDELRLSLRCAEDFQILDEVFIKSEYRYRIRRKHIVIDVGMNAGFASLFFANNEMAEAVYSFDPFSEPYSRAVCNFRNNPDIAHKINPHQIGLSDHDEDVEVKTVNGFTLGMTLRGLEHGEFETIRVRNAAASLGPLINDATSKELAIVLKLDCEGSEFSIFQSLAQASLLDLIDIIMVEWHKEWSHLLNQDDLVNPLVDRGFIVFDRTEKSAQMAGMLYAVRT